MKNNGLNYHTTKNFVKINPNNGKKERDTHKTEVKICYNNQSIFWSYHVHNTPDSILKEL